MRAWDIYGAVLQAIYTAAAAAAAAAHFRNTKKHEKGESLTNTASIVNLHTVVNTRKAFQLGGQNFTEISKKTEKSTMQAFPLPMNEIKWLNSLMYVRAVNRLQKLTAWNLIRQYWRSQMMKIEA